MADRIQIFQIFYNEETRAALDPEFEPLDNSSHQRPDWYEYWPIREFLLAKQLDESAYYGFLSPRFSRKTHLKGKQVKDFVSAAEGADVITFSPYPCQAACFFNVFEQGNFFHPGLAEVSSEFLQQISLKVDLRTLITHSRTTIFSNYFLAKPWFWKVWFDVLQRLFEITEGPPSPLGSRLNAEVVYKRNRHNVHMKIFVMERVVSLLLATMPGVAIRNFPPFEMPVGPDFRYKMREIVSLDALKVAFMATADGYYLDLFRILRDKLLQETGFVKLP